VSAWEWKPAPPDPGIIRSGIRDSSPVHPAAELLPMMPDAEIDELAQDIAANGLLEPVVFWADNTAQKESGQHWGLEHCPTYLLDGRSRLAAIKRLGRHLWEMRCLTKSPQHPAIVVPAWRRKPQAVIGAWPWRYFDPWAYLVSANIRRRHLSQMQKHEVIGKLLRRRPELSDRALAKLACVSDKTIAPARAEAEQCAEIPHIPPTERIGADGKKSRARLSISDAEPEFAPPQTWVADKRRRFLSPVKWNAPKHAKILAAHAYLAYLDLTVDDLLAGGQH
jgi:hypothetical protein